MDDKTRFNFYSKKIEMIENIKNQSHKEILKNYLDDSELINAILLSKKEQENLLRQKQEQSQKKREYITNIRQESIEREKRLDDIYLSRTPEYEYKLIVINDTHYGSTDIKEMEDTLYYYSIRGWRVKFIFTNELGVRGHSNTFAGSTISTNSTMDEVIVLLERKIIEV